MTEYETQEIVESAQDNTWKIQTLVVGAALGALTGLATAFLLTRRAEQSGKKLSISTGQGLKLGTLLAGLVHWEDLGRISQEWCKRKRL